MTEAEEADTAYDGIGYVVVDERGVPIHPEWYSDEFGRILRAARLRRITLHDSRHTTLSLMEKASVPISVISKWAGHHDSAFTQKRTSTRAMRTSPRAPRSWPRFTRSLSPCERL